MVKVRSLSIGQSGYTMAILLQVWSKRSAHQDFEKLKCDKIKKKEWENVFIIVSNFSEYRMSNICNKS